MLNPRGAITEKNEDFPELVPLAEELAVAAHRGQVDNAGSDYIDHPRRVAANARVLAERAGMPNEAADAVIAAAWLHDVV